MPPTRTIMPPAKLQKTERTHEENQERAYIAASRRSDRSLEARVESARRASEIHKRRTGRSLRVTEQDVINEEMYEEEDDDLPLQYRRLTAHLQTNNAEFNNRLAAYLTNHVAMRSALEQSIQHSYRQQGLMPPMPPQYSMYPSPMLAHQAQQQHMMQPPQSPSYRQAPYPSPRYHQQDPQMPAHQRSQSFAVPHDPSLSSSPAGQQPDMSRRMSVPVVPTSSASPGDLTSSPSPSSGTPRQQRPSFPPGSFSRAPERFQNSDATLMYNSISYTNTTFGPLSTALAPEAQGLLGPNFGFSNDPLSSNLMMGSQDTNLNSHETMKLPQDQPAGFEMSEEYPPQFGMRSTLAQSMDGDQDYNLQHSTYFNDAFTTDSASSTGTPGGGVDGDWSTFVEENAWEKPSTNYPSQ